MDEEKKMKLVQYGLLACLVIGVLILCEFCKMYIHFLNIRPLDHDTVLVLSFTGSFALFYVWLCMFLPIKVVMKHMYKRELERIYETEHCRDEAVGDFWFNKSSASWWAFWMLWFVGFGNLWNELIINNILDMEDSQIIAISLIPTAILLMMMAYPLSKIISDTHKLKRLVQA